MIIPMLTCKDTAAEIDFCKRAFDAILDDWRERLRKVDSDPLGDDETESISKKRLDRALQRDHVSDRCGDFDRACPVYSGSQAASSPRWRILCR